MHATMTAPHAPIPPSLADLSDEELCRLGREGSEGAERALLSRYLPAIYWLPQQVFGAGEEDLSGFLLFALEKIRDRDIVAKFDPRRGAKFSTWFGVVLQRLYLDFLRQQRKPHHVPTNVPWEPDDGRAVAEPQMSPEEAEALLAQMHIRCRALFKLLLCHAISLTPEEMRWIAEISAKSVYEVMREIATIEERLRNDEAKAKAIYDRLAAVWWWKQQCAYSCRQPAGEEENARLRRYQRQYKRLAAAIARGAGEVTAPYREIAKLLNMKEGTLASHLSRCRAQALALLGPHRRNGSTAKEG